MQMTVYSLFVNIVPLQLYRLSHALWHATYQDVENISFDTPLSVTGFFELAGGSLLSSPLTISQRPEVLNRGRVRTVTRPCPLFQEAWGLGSSLGIVLSLPSVMCWSIILLENGAGHVWQRFDVD